MATTKGYQHNNLFQHLQALKRRGRIRPMKANPKMIEAAERAEKSKGEVDKSDTTKSK